MTFIFSTFSGSIHGTPAIGSPSAINGSAAWTAFVKQEVNLASDLLHGLRNEAKKYSKNEFVNQIYLQTFKVHIEKLHDCNYAYFSRQLEIYFQYAVA